MKIGWLSPTGELHPCDDETFIAVSRQLLKQYYNIRNYDKPSDRLFELRWVHINNVYFNDKPSYIIKWNFEKGFTQEQKKYLKPFVEKNITNIVSYKRKILKELELKDPLLEE